MAELLSPGVYVEETSATVQVVGPVSTSTAAIVGLTQRGPSDEATLVSSFDEFQRVFGPIIKDSRVGLSSAAFFSNGGRRMYVVRTPRSDAVAADCDIWSQTTSQQADTGAAAALFSKTSGTTLLKVHSGASPIVKGSLSFKWREAGVAVGGGGNNTVKRNLTTALTLVNTGVAQTTYEGSIAPADMPTVDTDLPNVIAGTVTLLWTIIAGAKTVSLSSSSGWIDSGTSVAGSTASLDRRTGKFTLTLVGVDIPAVGDNGVNIKVTFTPATSTKTATDNGTGGFTGDVAGLGSIDYTTGAYSVTANAAVPLGMPILATYKIKAWQLAPISKGAWGNDLKVVVSGAADGFTATTASYTLNNVSIYLKDSAGSYQPVETYEDVDMSDSTSAMFFPDVLNELSSYVTVTDPGGDEPPGQLSGVAHTRVIAAGDALAASQVISITSSSNAGAKLAAGHLPIARRTVSITYTSAADSLVKTIVDNGSGLLIDASTTVASIDGTYASTVDTTGPNAVDYTNGYLNFKTKDAIKAGTFVMISYVTSPVETTHSEVFGDQTKSPASENYTLGSDGTAALSRTEVSDSSTLSATYRGLYALNRVDENMQVIIPDFAGDLLVTGDQLDYAVTRAALPSGGDRFIILTVPSGSSAQDAVDWFKINLARYSDYAALYWPWVKVADPLSKNRPMLFPALGHLAGIYARTDATKNVGKAPGGTVDGALNFLTGLELNPTQGERDLVYPNKINPLINTPQTGMCVWGVRTISNKSEWRYINARRLFMFLEKSVYNSTFWTVFENNGPALWSRIKTQLDSFMFNLFNEGYFASTAQTPAQAYTVKCDATNNPQTSIDAGVVNVDISAAPNKPAEFVKMRFSPATLT